MTANPTPEVSLRRRALEPLVVEVDPQLDPTCFTVGPEAVPWTTDDGQTHAICEMAGGFPRILFPHIGIIRVVDETGHVRATIADSARTAAIEEVYYRFALPMILQAAGAEMLHASGVMGNSGVVAFCGISGTGKSTLGFTLSRRGHIHWADDSLVFWPHEGRLETARLPFRPRIELPGVGSQERIEGKTVAPLAAITVLRRHPGGIVAPSDFHAEVHKLSAADAFRAILPHIYSFILSDAARNALMMSRYFDVAGQLPVFEVSFTPCLETLPRLCEIVERSILSAS